MVFNDALWCSTAQDSTWPLKTTGKSKSLQVLSSFTRHEFHNIGWDSKLDLKASCGSYKWHKGTTTSHVFCSLPLANRTVSWTKRQKMWNHKKCLKMMVLTDLIQKKLNWQVSNFTCPIRSLEFLYLLSNWCSLALPTAKELPGRFPFSFSNLCNRTMKVEKNETNRNGKKVSRMWKMWKKLVQR